MPRPRFSALAILVAVSFVVQPCSTFAARKKPVNTENLQSEIESINLQLDYLKFKVSDTLKKTRRLEDRIRNKKTEITQLQSQIEQLNLNQAETLAQINRFEEESRAGREHIKSLLARFRSRLVQLHKIRQGTLLSSVFSARDLNSFLNRYHMVKYLLQSDKDLIQDLKKQDLQQRKIAAELQKKHENLEAGKAELDEKQKKLDNENSALSAMLSTVLLEKKLFLAREKTLATARNQLEDEISRAESTLKNPEFENELAAPAVKPLVQPRKVPPAEGRIADSAPEAAKIMQFAWPVPRSNRSGVEETGNESSAAIQISVNGETEIAAAARGKVLYKGTIGGLGDVIILGHQRGFSSVYARLDDIWVGLNQIVEKGEVIGKISGGRNRALHFEIRFGGKKQQPTAYLPPEKGSQ